VVALVLLATLGGAWYAVHRAMPAWYARLWYPLDHAQEIRAEAQRQRLDPALVASVIYRESGFVPDSRSNRGAVGLMQVLPSTAQTIARQPERPSPPPNRLEDPGVNIAYGTWILRYLIDKFHSVPVALAAYNAGEANVRRWMDRAQARGVAFRVPDDIPFAETRHFVTDVESTRRLYRRAYDGELGRPVPGAATTA
jgi:soluble lytic murein transglycosylase